MWEVDPETKSKLLALQKQPANSICADCGSPSPQWASPKLGTFICLYCAGVHRGLGVHISFVRSVMMDSFKISEVRRMEEGGNHAWREFWDNHPDGGILGNRGVWECIDIERYTGDVAEEYKERLSAKVEGRDFTLPPRREKQASVVPATAASLGRDTSQGNPGPAHKNGSSAILGNNGKTDRNQAYFARLGVENANRPVDLAPSQGGKYDGFGGGIVSKNKGNDSARQDIPGADEFQKDPIAALSKGFGWLSSAVGKQAKNVNEGWIQPGVQKLTEVDLATQAKLTAASIAQNVQKGTKGATDSFTRFVEGAESNQKSGVQPEKKDFWDSFGGGKKTNSIGTSAMKGGGGTGDGKDDWEDGNWDKF